MGRRKVEIHGIEEQTQSQNNRTEVKNEKKFWTIERVSVELNL